MRKNKFDRVEVLQSCRITVMRKICGERKNRDQESVRIDHTIINVLSDFFCKGKNRYANSESKSNLTLVHIELTVSRKDSNKIH